MHSLFSYPYPPGIEDCRTGIPSGIRNQEQAMKEMDFLPLNSRQSVREMAVICIYKTLEVDKNYLHF